MSSIFSKIVAGELPCHRVAETDRCLAFLDINPVVRGHVLCIPKQEVDNIFDLSAERYAELHLFARRVALALQQVVPCVKVGQAVVGLDVPHAHIHLIPLNQPSDLDFRHHIATSSADLQSLAEALAKAYAQVAE